MNNTTVTVGEARLSYVNVFQPYAHNAGQDPKFSVTILIPKTDIKSKAAIDAAIEAAKQLGTAQKWNGVCPPQVPTPVHDGDGVRPNDGMPFGEECKGHWVFTANANATRPPQVVDINRQPILDQSQVYSGMYGYVNINFFAYMATGRKGIGCGLNAVLKTRDGEVLGGSRVTVNEAFADIPMAAPNPVQPRINPLTGQPM